MAERRGGARIQRGREGRGREAGKAAENVGGRGAVRCGGPQVAERKACQACAGAGTGYSCLSSHVPQSRLRGAYRRARAVGAHWQQGQAGLRHGGRGRESVTWNVRLAALHGPSPLVFKAATRVGCRQAQERQSKYNSVPTHILNIHDPHSEVLHPSLPTSHSHVHACKSGRVACHHGGSGAPCTI